VSQWLRPPLLLVVASVAGVRPVFVQTAALALVLVTTGCGDDGGMADPPGEQRALPSGPACTQSSGEDEESRAFDATALVPGPTTHDGRSVELTICFVPPASGRAVATVAVEGGSDAIVAARPTIDWPEVAGGERQVTTVGITVADGGRAPLRTTIELFDAAGQPAGRYVDSTYLRGGPDAVFVSERSLSHLDQVALQHDRDAGRISDGEYRRLLEERQQPAPLSR